MALANKNGLIGQIILDNMLMVYDKGRGKWKHSTANMMENGLMAKCMVKYTL